jgi:hypothetical protein
MRYASITPYALEDWMKTSHAAVTLSLLALLITSVSAEERRNWFNDPFLQLSADQPACPTPNGPLLTEAQMREQAHSRIERGNSCYRSQNCRHASAYGYDRGIAEAARRHLQRNTKLRGSSLWLTVQRRFIKLEGCARSRHQIDYLRRVLGKLPDVQLVDTDGVTIR